MEKRLLKTTTPVARKEHTCAVCGKQIRKGERYLNVTIAGGEKLQHRKTHLTCNEPLTKKDVFSINPNTHMTEREFKEGIYRDSMTMLRAFSFEENMNIAFVPLIITEVAWKYVDKVVQYGIEHKLSETRNLSRYVKELRHDYVATCMKDLDKKHMEQVSKIADNYINKCQKDLSLLYLCVDQELKNQKVTSQYQTLKVYAYIGAIFLQILERHTKKMDAVIKSRVGTCKSFRNPYSWELEQSLKSYLAPAKLKASQHIETSMTILQNKLRLIQFHIKD